MQYIAHIKDNGERQTCEGHCRMTAQYAMDALLPIGLGQTAYLAGLLHDEGKFSEEFLSYIMNTNSQKKGSVIHSFAGVYDILKNYSATDTAIKKLTCELIAYAVGSHHGLFDCVDKNGDNGFNHRLTKQADYEKRAIRNFNSQCATKEEISELLNQSEIEIQNVYKIILKMISEKPAEECTYYLGVLARLVLSAVIEGDRRDTAIFMNGTDFESIAYDPDEVWNQSLLSLESYIKNFNTTGAINGARHEFSERCAQFSAKPSGIYQLNLPTGGGKTVSAMRYAMEHAKKFNKKRIIYVAPLISILDQNIKVIRNIVQNDDIILEHHSNLIMDDDINNGEKVRHDLYAETWNSPIILTTLVQFLNTMFSGKTTSVRRFHALCDSVIIIDEVQSVPNKLLSMFNLTVNFLNKVCGACIILCSATQPTFDKAKRPLNISQDRFLSDSEMKHYNEIFKRTNIIDKSRFNLEDIPEFAAGISDSVDSLLVVCNTKAEAKTVFERLKVMNRNCYHLSASMCMKHRENLLNTIRAKLKNKEKFICVSTQVIEAGVDISFQSVIRFSAGIDNIVQAAGRCNRNGEGDCGNVYVIHCNNEKLGMLKDIKRAQDAYQDLLTEYEKRPENLDNDLASEKSIIYYYKSLYREIEQSSDMQDYPVKDFPSIFDMLSDNTVSWTENPEENSNYCLHQAFKTAGEKYSVFDDNTQAVIVPYGEGAEYITKLNSEKAKHDPIYTKKILTKSKEYTVNLFKYQVDKLDKNKGIYPIGDHLALAISKDYYDEECGIQTEEKGDEQGCNILMS